MHNFAGGLCLDIPVPDPKSSRGGKPTRGANRIRTGCDGDTLCCSTSASGPCVLEGPVNVTWPVSRAGRLPGNGTSTPSSTLWRAAAALVALSELCWGHSLFSPFHPLGSGAPVGAAPFRGWPIRVPVPLVTRLVQGQTISRADVDAHVGAEVASSKGDTSPGAVLLPGCPLRGAS